MKRRWVAGLLLMAALAGVDAGQRWLWLQAPELTDRGDWTASHERVLLVAGPTLDAEEQAAVRRDLAHASQVLPGALRHASAADELDAALAAVGAGDTLTVYLSGHGGGRNFGAAGSFNLSRDELADRLSALSCRQLLVLLDCCWSGEFHRSFAGRAFRAPCTLVTSTDATHMAPFPTSFLAPRSFGREFLAHYRGDALQALQTTNSRRRWLAPFYSGLLSVEGQAAIYR